MKESNDVEQGGSGWKGNALMPNLAVPPLREFLLAHEDAIANGVVDFGLLKAVFKHLEGREAVAVVHVNAPPPTSPGPPNTAS